MRATVALVAASLVLLAGCGDETADPSASPSEKVTSLQPTETTGEPSLVPECGTVWKAGARLSIDYAGCLDGTGTIVGGDGTYCESGQMIFTNGTNMYAAAGRKIMQVGTTLKRDKAYQATLKSCRG